MKTFLILSLFYCSTTWLYAQDNDSIQFVHGLPVTGEDTAQEVPQHDNAPIDKTVKVEVDSVPGPLAEALDDFPPLENWRNETVVFDMNTKLYWIHVNDDSTVRSYAYSKEGHPVTLKEKTRSE